MTFAHPYFLLFLLLLPVLAWLKGRRGQESAFLYSSVQLVKGITTLNRSRAGSILAKLRWLSLALLIVAMARPQLGEGEAKIKASGIDIVVALDLSGSMASEDFELHGERANRLMVAKDVLEQFIAKRLSDRIGLVAFAGRAYIAAPVDPRSRFSSAKSGTPESRLDRGWHRHWFSALRRFESIARIEV